MEPPSSRAIPSSPPAGTGDEPNSGAATNRLTLRLTPSGHLHLDPSPEAPPLEQAAAVRLRTAFAQGMGAGLLTLGAVEVGRTFPPVFTFWRDFGSRYVAALRTRHEGAGGALAAPPPRDEELDSLTASRPLMPGAEYLTPDVLRTLWTSIGEAIEAGQRRFGGPLQDYLQSLNPAWNLVGRVHFNLAENRKDDEAPFAFLATYTHKLSAHGRAQHLPLGQALGDYAGRAQKSELLSLLIPVQRAAESVPWLRQLVDDGALFHPLRWSPDDAYRMLRDVPQLEDAGVVVRMPAHWSAGRPARPQVTATVGGKPPSGLGQDALLDFRMAVTLEGEALSQSELEALLARTDGLAFVRGRWVEIDRDRLGQVVEQFRSTQRLAERNGLTFAEAARLLSGANLAEGDASADQLREWSRVVAGPWLTEALQGLRSPEGLARVDPGKALRGTLRPYQQVGVRWLHLLSRLGLGACLADDMGLGKTIQVLALLLVERKEERPRRPNLLVAPASLLGNWSAEIERFAPSLETVVAHPSALSSRELEALSPKNLGQFDLVLTTYGSLLRMPLLTRMAWDLAILDEAQAIKNPGAKQTRAVKRLEARARVVLTGTPVENRLGDLWSIFDFLNPGLLGSAKEFTAYTKRLATTQHNPYGPLRELVQPYVLRRLKTDRSVIADLPDKVEMKAFCPLSRKQAALYEQAIKDLSDKLARLHGIERRGVVLASLLRLKQICNHPSHWLGDGAWEEQDSGKWARLREIAEVVAARQEKALVFTQFREITEPLAAFLALVFGKTGLVLHGGTEVRKRKDLVKRFQEDESVPFFVLSVKAGGTGLNLTAASHVVHFDRWWNPAVENQATDRAFRIGQTRNVLVHKFVCRGTVEEKIDTLIASKNNLTQELLEGGSELNLTEFGNDELLRLVALDLRSAMEN